MYCHTHTYPNIGRGCVGLLEGVCVCVCVCVYALSVCVCVYALCVCVCVYPSLNIYPYLPTLLSHPSPPTYYAPLLLSLGREWPSSYVGRYPKP